MLRLESICWPVGQGLFSELRLYRCEEIIFRLVYDCGTESKLLQSSKDKLFNNEKANDHGIDILVISHLHSDHISLIPKLKDSVKNKIRNVWLPYIAPVSKNLTLLPFYWSLPIDFSDDYFDLLQIIQNPSSYFSESIINFIGDENEFVYRPGELEFSIYATNILNNDDFNAKALTYPSNNFPFFRIFTWNHKVDNTKITALDKDITRLLGKPLDIQENRIEMNEIVKAVNEKKLQLQNIYRRVNRNLNNTSLGLLFEIDNKTEILELCKRGFCPKHSDIPNKYHCCYTKEIKSNVNLLHLGDMESLVLELMLNDLGFSNKLGDTIYWQVPHHGAKSSFSKNLYDKLVNAESNIACGIDNKHKHPSFDVVDETKSNIIHQYSKPCRNSYLII